MTPSQTSLMEQCRREAEAKHPLPEHHEEKPVETTSGTMAHAMVYAKREAHAQALYSERSKAKTCSMSRDYDALYDLLRDGGEALGFVYRQWPHLNSRSRSIVNPKRIQSGDLVVDENTATCFGTKETFIAECTRLNLEWLAPSAGLTVDVTEIVQIAAVCAGEAWSGYVPSGQVVGSPFGKFRNDFRSRLTAILQSKSK